MKPLGKSLADGDNVLEPQIARRCLCFAMRIASLWLLIMLPGLIRNFWARQ